jgi:hypothetical protein
MLILKGLGHLPRKHSNRELDIGENKFRSKIPVICDAIDSIREHFTGLSDLYFILADEGSKSVDKDLPIALRTGARKLPLIPYRGTAAIRRIN